MKRILIILLLFGMSYSVLSQTKMFIYKISGTTDTLLLSNVDSITFKATPVLTTTSISNKTQTAATSGGNVTSEGSGVVTARGVCWSTLTNPTIANSKTSDGTGAGIFTSSITGLTPGNAYYVRAYATNNAGTAYGNEISFTAGVVIGDSYQGGKVFYILQSGDPGYIAGEIHGLIVAPSNQGYTEWGYTGSTMPGADGTAIGTGNQNTIDIVTGYSYPLIAARYCYDLVLDGYSDWYLPSKDELHQLYLNRAAISGLSSFYWSSSECDATGAWVRVFTNGSEYCEMKGNPVYVRAVRSF